MAIIPTDQLLIEANLIKNATVAGDLGEILRVNRLPVITLRRWIAAVVET